jgi:Fe-S cluster biogenesis protein NfuA
MEHTRKAILLLGISLSVSAWVPSTQRTSVARARRWAPVVQSAPVVSPFAERLEDDDEDEGGDLDNYGPANPGKAKGTYELTLQNVEMILDEMRPYLISDGGNVEVAEIDGPVVRLQLIGACGSCPSSTMTMKMGLERRLKEVSYRRYA